MSSSVAEGDGRIEATDAERGNQAGAPGHEEECCGHDAEDERIRRRHPKEEIIEKPGHEQGCHDACDDAAVSGDVALRPRALPSANTAISFDSSAKGRGLSSTASNRRRA